MVRVVVIAQEVVSAHHDVRPTPPDLPCDDVFGGISSVIERYGIPCTGRVPRTRRDLGYLELTIFVEDCGSRPAIPALRNGISVAGVDKSTLDEGDVPRAI